MASRFKSASGATSKTVPDGLGGTRVEKQQATSDPQGAGRNSGFIGSWSSASARSFALFSPKRNGCTQCFAVRRIVLWLGCVAE